MPDEDAPHYLGLPGSQGVDDPAVIEDKFLSIGGLVVIDRNETVL